MKPYTYMWTPDGRTFSGGLTRDATAAGKIHDVVVGAWPTAGAWTDLVWDAWVEELDECYLDEVLQAVRFLSRRAQEFPPRWGQVYAMLRGRINDRRHDAYEAWKDEQRR